jgi:hypothetical protein
MVLGIKKRKMGESEAKIIGGKMSGNKSPYINQPTV